MKSLKWKIVLMYIVLIIFVMAACGIYILVSVRQNEYSNIQTNMQYLAGRIIDAMELSDYEEETPAEVFAHIVSSWALESTSEGENQGQLIYFLDNRADTLYCWGTDLTEKERSSRLLVNCMAGTASSDLYVHRDSSQNMVADWAVSFSLEGEQYIILIRQSMERVQSSLYNTGNTILISIVIGIATAGVLGYVIAAGITRPLLKLSKKTQRLAAGELEVHIRDNPPDEDELDRLNNNFNDMAHALNAKMFELNEEKDKLHTIFQYMTDGLLLYDMNGTLSRWNPAAVAMLGEKILKQSLEKTFPGVKRYSILESSAAYSQMVQVGEGYANVVFVPFRNETEEFVGFIVVLQDVTERQRMESLQKEFVANVSHELRTPITTIKSYVETLMDSDGMDAATEQHFLGVIDSEADRMTRLINELLELSKMDSHQNHLPNREVNLVAVVQECIQKYRIHAIKKGQELRYEGPEEAWLVGNTGQLAQVFRNLLMNAITYSEDKTVIYAGIEVRDDSLLAYVRDQGIGIDPKDQKRIFERFYRVDKARSRAMGGTGLGLAIVKEIVDMHNGKIWVESKPGEGSTFWIRFPKKKEKGDRDDEENSAASVDRKPAWHDGSADLRGQSGAGVPESADGAS